MGFFSKLKAGLSKTRANIVSGFNSVFTGRSAIDDDFYDDLEEIMIMGDMGVRATDEILDDLREKVKKNKIKEPAECKQLLIDSIREKMDIGENEYRFENEKSVVLVIGVNGVGKTTSVGKLASSFKSQGKKVLLAAADTFRAGAIEQLKVWAERSGVDIIAQSEGSDPAAVVFDSVQAAKARDTDILIADTAGRLHNKKNLMNELSKINRVIDREYPGVYRENLIVLDATTGQNAIQQLKEFNDVTDITGIILTKMDGTAKGGIVVAIQAEFGIPVKYIGVGEKIEDLQKFDSNSFVEVLFDDSEVDNDDEETSFVGLGDDEDELFYHTSDETASEEETSEENADNAEAAEGQTDEGNETSDDDEEELSAFELGEIFKQGIGDVLSADSDDILGDGNNMAAENVEAEEAEDNTSEKADRIVAEEVKAVEEVIEDTSDAAESDVEETTDNADEDTEDTSEETSEEESENDEAEEEQPKKKKGFFSWFRG